MQYEHHHCLLLGGRNYGRRERKGDEGPKAFCFMVHLSLILPALLVLLPGTESVQSVKWRRSCFVANAPPLSAARKQLLTLRGGKDEDDDIDDVLAVAGEETSSGDSGDDEAEVALFDDEDGESGGEDDDEEEEEQHLQEVVNEEQVAEKDDGEDDEEEVQGAGSGGIERSSLAKSVASKAKSSDAEASKVGDENPGVLKPSPPPPNPMSQMMNQMLVTFGAMALVRKLDLGSPVVKKNARLAYICYHLVIQLLVLYVQFKCKAALKGGNYSGRMVTVESAWKKMVGAALKSQGGGAKDLIDSSLNTKSQVRVPGCRVVVVRRDRHFFVASSLSITDLFKI